MCRDHQMNRRKAVVEEIVIQKDEKPNEKRAMRWLGGGCLNEWIMCALVGCEQTGRCI